MPTGRSNPFEAFRALHTDIEQLEFLLADINGVLRGKRLPIKDLDKLHAGELLLPRATVLLDTLGEASPRTPFGYQDGDPDRAVLPLEATLSPMTWADSPTAQILTVMSDEPGKPWFANPRTVLERCLEPFAALSLTPVAAIELEFHLLDTSAGSPAPVRRGSSLPAFAGPQTYNPEMLDDFEPLFSDIDRACAAIGVPTGSVLSEFGTGQFEINLAHHEDLLRVCDEAVLLKRVVRQCALKHGYLPSFMAKPLEGDSGNGLHVHLSLLDRQGNNRFASNEDGSLSSMLEQVLVGLIRLLPESVALLAPNANSYRRFEPDSFAPRVADWGHDHRAVAIRIPRAKANAARLEHRAAGADANPYLALATVLAGVLHGLERSGTLLEPSTGTTPNPEASPLPDRWSTALQAFADSTVLPHYLGDEFCSLYRTVKEDEEAARHRRAIHLDHDDYLRLL